MTTNYFKFEYIVRVITLITVWLIYSIPVSSHLHAQRAFCATEQGVMKELKTGEHSLLNANIKVPKGTVTAISSPLKIYLRSEHEIELKELNIHCVATHSRTNAKQLYKPINLKKHAKFQKIDDNIFLLEVDDSKLNTIGTSPVFFNYLTFTNEVAIVYNNGSVKFEVEQSGLSR